MSSINRKMANMDLHSTHIMQLPLDQAMDIVNELCKTPYPNRIYTSFVVHITLVGN